MKNPITRLLTKLKLRKTPPARIPLLSDNEETTLKAAVSALTAPQPPTPAIPKQPRGRVVKNTKQTEFNPNTTRRGGRVVKVMPRQLQKIKEAQEMPVEDD